MATTKKVIGRVPVVRYPYASGMVLYKGNLVTVDGVTYEVIADQTTDTPSQSSADFRVFAGVPNEILAQKVDKSMITDELVEDNDLIPTSAAVSEAVGNKLNAAALEHTISGDEHKVPCSKAVKEAMEELTEQISLATIIYVESEEMLEQLQQQGLLVEGQLYGILED